jgi:hypothetical protein
MASMKINFSMNGRLRGYQWPARAILRGFALSVTLVAF